MKQSKNTGNQTSVKNAKKKERYSQECELCVRSKNCMFKNTMVLFEEETNTELDCWLRKTDKEYITGFHMPMNHLAVVDGIRKSFVKWQHILSDEYSIIIEDEMYN